MFAIDYYVICTKNRLVHSGQSGVRLRTHIETQMRRITTIVMLTRELLIAFRLSLSIMTFRLIARSHLVIFCQGIIYRTIQLFVSWKWLFSCFFLSDFQQRLVIKYSKLLHIPLSRSAQPTDNMSAESQSPATPIDPESDDEILTARCVRIFRVRLDKANVPCEQDPDILRLSREVKHELDSFTSMADPATHRDLQNLLSEICSFLGPSGCDTYKRTSLKHKSGCPNLKILTDFQA